MDKDIKKVKKRTALKKKVGSVYHPTSKTIRTGECPIGEVGRKGYYRHAYEKKDGHHIKGSYVKRSCIKDVGMPGKVISSAKVIPKLKEGALSKYGYSTDLTEKERLVCLVKAIKELTYAGVIRRINAIRTLTKSNPKLFKIYTKDIENLQQWRVKHPEEK
jgi:hypothetical protein